jgi:hypothetical protein
MRPLNRSVRPAVWVALLYLFCFSLVAATALARRAPQSDSAAPLWPSAAPGLRLPVAGSVWVLDHENGEPVLVHLGYLPTSFNPSSTDPKARLRLPGRLRPSAYMTCAPSSFFATRM